MIYHLLAWYIMIYHSLSWFIMIDHDGSWFIMGFHDLSWFIMIHHDFSWFIMVCPCWNELLKLLLMMVSEIGFLVPETSWTWAHRTTWFALPGVHDSSELGITTVASLEILVQGMNWARLFLEVFWESQRDLNKGNWWHMANGNFSLVRGAFIEV